MQLAALGVPVFPCEWQGDAAKRPKISKRDGGDGFHDATTDAQTVTGWWSSWPSALVGTPIPPGVAVVDTDDKVDPDTGEVWSGDDTLRAAGLIEDADTAALIVRTAGGGLHRWFTVEDADDFSNTSNVNGAACVDLRTAGKGYVIAPGCAYERGAYVALKGAMGCALSPMPSRLVDALRKPEPTPSSEAGAAVSAGEYAGPGWAVDAGRNRLSPRGRGLLEKRLRALFGSIIRTVRTAQPGNRHRPLLSAARSLGGYLHYQAFTRADCEAALFAASVENGHVQKDGEGMTRAAIRAGLDDGYSCPLALENRRAA